MSKQKRVHELKILRVTNGWLVCTLPIDTVRVANTKKLENELATWVESVLEEETNGEED